MSIEVLDARGLKCPQPVLRLAVRAPEMKAGELPEVLGDCPTFERDLRTWCDRLGKALLGVTEEPGGAKRIRIQF